MRGRGLLERFLYAVPRSLVGTRLFQDRPVDARAEHAYIDCVRRLFSLPWRDETDPEVHHQLKIEGAALECWTAFADRIEFLQAPGASLEPVADWASKLAGQVARIAALIHIVHQRHRADPWALPVARETVEATVEIAEYLIPHALTAFTEMSTGKKGTDPVTNPDVGRAHWPPRGVH